MFYVLVIVFVRIFFCCFVLCFPIFFLASISWPCAAILIFCVFFRFLLLVGVPVFGQPVMICVCAGLQNAPALRLLAEENAQAFGAAGKMVNFSPSLGCLFVACHAQWICVTFWCGRVKAPAVVELISFS